MQSNLSKLSNIIFLTEHIGGTLQPDALCNVDYYGMSAASHGTIYNSGDQHVFWNVEGSLKCVHRFIPAANQSIVVQVRKNNITIFSSRNCLHQISSYINDGNHL